MLQIDAVTLRVAGRPLLEEATASVNAGDKLGLVGRNGCGKTSLLRLIAQREAPERGTIALSRAVRVGMIAQDPPGGPESLRDAVLSADKEREALLAEAESAEDPARIAEIHERLAAIGADSAPARAARILAGLGFDEAAQMRPCASFSGGWRMRVALAALLFSEPDLLLLDEPTNHLDLEASLWLESWLKGFSGTLILVSHDRDLLNAVPESILHLDGHRLTRYSGNYDRFERTRREQQARQAALHKRQEAERKHIQAFVDRFRYKASKARQAQSRLKALAKLEPIACIAESESPPIRFPEPKPLAPPILTLERAAVGYDADQPVLRRLDLRIDMDDRIALLGANGNGKTTFLKLLAGALQPASGALNRSRGLEVGYFAQDQAEALDLTASPLQALARLQPRDSEERLRNQLGRFGFGQATADTPTGSLSGGEKARLLLALMSRRAPQLLLLDEPSNHLDIDSRESLIQALNAFEGAVLLVTHDPHLIDPVADRLWLVAEGTVQPFEGDLGDYRRSLQAQRRGERAAVAEKPRAEAPAKGKEKRRASADARAAAAHLRRAARDAESELERLTREKQALEQRLADPAVSQAAPEQLVALNREHHALTTAIAAAESAWLEAQEALEAATAA